MQLHHLRWCLKRPQQRRQAACKPFAGASNAYPASPLPSMQSNSSSATALKTAAIQLAAQDMVGQEGFCHRTPQGMRS